MSFWHLNLGRNEPVIREILVPQFFRFDSETAADTQNQQVPSSPPPEYPGGEIPLPDYPNPSGDIDIDPSNPRSNNMNNSIHANYVVNNSPQHNGDSTSKTPTPSNEVNNRS